MIKYLKISFLVMLLISIGLSGCMERKVEIIGDTDRIEILNYEIGTYDIDKNKISDGFSNDNKAYYYKITGEVKNIADTPFDRIWVSAKFLDRNDNYLDDGSYMITQFAINEVANFSISYTNSQPYFKDIWNVHFILTVLNE